MPNSRGIRGEQWAHCDQCGRRFPMSQLVKQKGLLVCTESCFDNLEVERRQQVIERILLAGVDQEGTDMRVYDRGFFEGHDEEVV